MLELIKKIDEIALSTHQEKRSHLWFLPGIAGAFGTGGGGGGIAVQQNDKMYVKY